MHRAATILNEEAEVIMLALEEYIRRHDSLEENVAIAHKMHSVIKNSNQITLLDDGDEVFMED